MSTPETQPPPSSEAATAALLTLLAANLALQGPVAAVAATALGVSTGALAAAYGLAASVPLPPIPTGPGARYAAAVNVAFRAAFVAQAAKRLSTGGKLAAERDNLRLHLVASKARAGAAQAVDGMAAIHGPVLGWQSVQDTAVTPGCRQASGNNFWVSVPPVIEGARVLPGWLHGGMCRCRPVAPFPAGTLLP